jgi:hypothetical protein
MIKNGRDRLIWIGRIDIIIGQPARPRDALASTGDQGGGGPRLGAWNWHLFSPNR